ncbi:cytokine-like protein 1 [Saimiri boliviensis]|uniref:Cytokine like 1 n=1 Tax=Saimiri boliviensis boliviensis TaxID=39432 RepID=A0A2K6SSC4_SAIBB|nr:cytokine-like protein 1 [Saimiri boliviensis boliviensis]XP_010343583.1 cytokine-like protein 1 [Saimiri boliviensis boliviensis]
MRTPGLLPVLLLLLAGVPAARPAPSTCYSRLRALSREVTEDFQLLLRISGPSEPCVRYLPRLYLDIHNYCVLDKLRDFVASSQCRKVAQVDSLKEKARKLYTIMNSFCSRDLVFLSDDCNALDYPIPATTVLPYRQR